MQIIGGLLGVDKSKYLKYYLGVVLTVVLASTSFAPLAQALELVQDTNPITGMPKAPASDVIFDSKTILSDKTKIKDIKLGEKFRSYDKIYYRSECADNRPTGSCSVTEDSSRAFTIFYHPDANELVRGQEKIVDGLIAEITYTDVAEDINGTRLDFVVKLSNLKITPMPNLPASSTAKVPQQEWVLFSTEDKLAADLYPAWHSDRDIVQRYVNCWKDSACDISDPNLLNNQYMAEYDVSFNLYKIGTKEDVYSIATFGFKDLDQVRIGPNELHWSDLVGKPLIREGVHLKSGVVGDRVYTTSPLETGSNYTVGRNDGFRLRVADNNSLLEASCFKYNGDNPVVADGDQTSNCKGWSDDDSYNTGFAVQLSSGSSFSWHGGSSLGTVFFETFGSMLNLSKTVDKTEVKIGDTINYTIDIKNKDGADPVVEDVLLVDVLPDELEIVDIPSSCEKSEQTVTCIITPGTINNSKTRSVSFQITAKVKSFAKDKIKNTAKINISNYDNCNTNRKKVEGVKEGEKECSDDSTILILPVTPPKPPAAGLIARSFVATTAVLTLGYAAYRLSAKELTWFRKK